MRVMGFMQKVKQSLKQRRAIQRALRNVVGSQPSDPASNSTGWQPAFRLIHGNSTGSQPSTLHVFTRGPPQWLRRWGHGSGYVPGWEPPLPPDWLATAVARTQALVRIPETPRQRDLPSVPVVHQIFGIFKDGVPMSDLFRKSNSMWKAVAKAMDAEYHLWDPDEVESLVCRKYPWFWEMYKDTRYPGMRCDIARIVIIHCYGGLYADLDVLPNRTWYEQVEVGFPCVEYLGLSASVRLCMPKPHVSKEVIIGGQGNQFFIAWLEHIRREIACRPYADESSYWYKARMRYVFNTTGALSLARFLRSPSSAVLYKDIHKLRCNHFSEEAYLTEVQRNSFDLISHKGQSYFTTAHHIRVPVGFGAQPLPPLSTTPCRVRKRSGPEPWIPDRCSVTPTQQFEWLTNQTERLFDAERSQFEWRQRTESPETEDSVASDGVHAISDEQHDGEMACELRAFFRRYEHSYAARVCVALMSHELRTWLAVE